MNDLKTWTDERLEAFTNNESEHLHRYALALELVAGKHVLDIASGEGYGSNLLATAANHVTGIDVDAVTVALANREYKRPNLKFLTGSIANIPCKTGDFDIVVSFEAIAHHDHEKIMLEIRRVLKPGGLLIISLPNKADDNDQSKQKNPFKINVYRDGFEALLKKYFKKTSLLQQRPFCGSVIMQQAQLPGNKDAKMYIGNNGNTIDTEAEAQYLIWLASDDELPSLKPSLYGGETILKQQFEVFRKMVTQAVTADVTREIKNSPTYKIGDAILKRWQGIKNLFGKKTAK